MGRGRGPLVYHDELLLSYDRRQGGHMTAED